jgi:Fe-S cluster biogenesis protein NfuA
MVMTEAALEERVRKALDEIRPRLQADGGDLGFVGMDDGIVKVKLQGSCAGCPMSQMTIQWGVERYLKSKIPEVKSVEAV